MFKTLALVGVLLFGLHAVAGADSCDGDCDNNCRVSFPGGNFVSPGCKARCKAGEELCRHNLPTIPAPAMPGSNPIEQVCAQAFNQFATPVLAACPGDGGDQDLFQMAKSVLVAQGFLSASDVAGVNTRWCDAVSSGDGVAPDYNVIIMNSLGEHLSPRAVRGCSSAQEDLIFPRARTF